MVTQLGRGLHRLRRDRVPVRHPVGSRRCRLVQRGAHPRSPLRRAVGVRPVRRGAARPRADAQRARHRRRDQGPLRRRAQRPHRAARRVDGRTPVDGSAGRPGARVCGDAPRRRQGRGPDPPAAPAARPGRRRTSRRSPTTRRWASSWCARSSSSTAPSTASGTTTNGGTAPGTPTASPARRSRSVSRVIAVADAFDALTTDRAERPGLRARRRHSGRSSSGAAASSTRTSSPRSPRCSSGTTGR